MTNPDGQLGDLRKFLEELGIKDVRVVEATIDENGEVRVTDVTEEALESPRKFEPGDRVTVTGGELYGYYGRVDKVCDCAMASSIGAKCIWMSTYGIITFGEDDNHNLRTFAEADRELVVVKQFDLTHTD